MNLETLSGMFKFVAKGQFNILLLEIKWITFYPGNTPTLIKIGVL